MSELAPIALFVYNRLAHTRTTVNSLLKNAQAAQSDLLVFSDGGKDDADKAKVAEVRDYLKTITGFRSVEVAESAANKGLSASVIGGVSEATGKYGKVIVVEDDLVFSPYFLQFMNDALEAYSDEERVCNVHGHVFDIGRAPETFLINHADSWGWATWARAWRLFEPDGRKLLDELRQRNLCRKFDFDGTYGFTHMLERQVNGENDSWAIRWKATLMLRDKLAVNAGKSLVRNIGFDQSGTNCGGGELIPTVLYDGKIECKKIFPIEENDAARRAIARMYRWNNSKLHKAWVEGRFRLRKLFSVKN